MCAGVLIIPPQNRATDFFVLCLISLFPHFSRFLFPFRAAEELSWDRIWIKHQEPKFWVAGECKPHFLFWKANASSGRDQELRNFANPEIIKVIIQKIPLPKCIAPHTLHPEQNQGSQTPGDVRTKGAPSAWREGSILLETGNFMF